MKRIAIIIWLALLVSPVFALVPPLTLAQSSTAADLNNLQSEARDVCPAKIVNLWIHSIIAGRDALQQPYADMKLQNNDTRAIKSIEYQIDYNDPYRRVFLARYYFQVGGVLGESVGGGRKSQVKPGTVGSLRGPVGGLFRLNEYIGDSEDKSLIVNVLHFMDGTKWERKGWKDEPNPNR